MSKEIFKKNLQMAAIELDVCNIEEMSKCRFIIVPIIEQNKKYNSKDEVMIRWIFTEENIGGKVLDVDSVVDVFSGLDPLYPIWINVSSGCKEKLIIQLETSLRFRKPSELKNVETGHPPFKVIKNG